MYMCMCLGREKKRERNRLGLSGGSTLSHCQTAALSSSIKLISHAITLFFTSQTWSQSSFRNLSQVSQFRRPTRLTLHESLNSRRPEIATTFPCPNSSTTIYKKSERTSTPWSRTTPEPRKLPTKKKSENPQITNRRVAGRWVFLLKRGSDADESTCDGVALCTVDN